MANKIVKCRFSGCLHESKEIPIEEAVKVGKSYYHKDCYKTKEDIALIMDLFLKKINPNAVCSQLRKIINTIIYEKNYSSDYLLFCLNYYIENKITLNYPAGLYYVVQNKKAKEAYRKKISSSQQTKHQISIDDVEENTFSYKAPEQTGFAAILGK